MSLKVGNEQASEGMSKAIHQELQKLFLPHFSDVDMTQEDLNRVYEGWKKLSYAIAKGVVEYILENMEILGIQTKGNVNTTVEGNTEPLSSGGHKHKVDLTGKELDVIFKQCNDGTGLIR